MAAGKDDVVITDAYVALSPAGGPEGDILTGTPFFVVVKAEAGTNAIMGGVPYTIQAVLQNQSAFAIVFNGAQSGALAAPAPPNALPFVAPVPAWTVANTDVTFVATAGAAGPPGTIYKILAFASLGAAQKNVNSFESELIHVSS